MQLEYQTQNTQEVRVDSEQDGGKNNLTCPERLSNDKNKKLEYLIYRTLHLWKHVNIQYIEDLNRPHQPNSSLRSENTDLLNVPTEYKSQMGGRNVRGFLIQT